MKILIDLRAWFVAYARAQQHRIDKKSIYLGLSLLVAMWFADTVLHFIGHILHVLIEIIESVAEHFLESMFHVSPKQAELIVFYTGLLIAMCVLTYLVRYVYVWGSKTYQAIQQKWLYRSKSAKFATFLRATFIISALMTTLFMFT